MPDKQHPHKLSVRSGETGLGRFFGRLEAEIMEVVWAQGEVTIREVWDRLRTTRRLSFNTVMTVLQRLADKGLLYRDGQPRSYRFRPVEPKNDFLLRVTREFSRDLMVDFGESAIAGFLDSLGDLDPEFLDRAEELIKQKKDRISHDKTERTENGL